METKAEFLDRREFVKILGPGLYFLFSLDRFLLGQQPGGRMGGYPEDFNAYLRIAEDGHVTCYAGKVELGQGVTASLAQMLAEELEVPFDSVSIVLGRHNAMPVGWRHQRFPQHKISWSGIAGRRCGSP